MDSSSFVTLSKFTTCATIMLLCLSCFGFTATDARRDNGNIRIRWDVISWIPDGYIGIVTIFNFQHRYIGEPGWELGWSWAKREVIWNMIGAQTTQQGDCSRFKGYIPHSCRRDPIIVDLLPDTPYNLQVANCCKGGVLKPNAASAFQISVGVAGTTTKTVRLPKNFVFKAPGAKYTCAPPEIVRPTRFISPDKRRVTQAFMTWNVTCTASRLR